MGLRELLIDPKVASIDVDLVDQIVKHRELLLQKPMIREVFFEIYGLLRDAETRYFRAGTGRKIEIGSGSSLLKTVVPEVELTDVVPYEGLDRVVDAMNMPYQDGSLKTVFGVHCFHHLSDPYKFLSEIERVCSRGGGAILVDPYFGPGGLAGVQAIVHQRAFRQGGTSGGRSWRANVQCQSGPELRGLQAGNRRLREEIDILELVSMERSEIMWLSRFGGSQLSAVAARHDHSRSQTDGIRAVAAPAYARASPYHCDPQALKTTGVELGCGQALGHDPEAAA